MGIGLKIFGRRRPLRALMISTTKGLYIKCETQKQKDLYVKAAESGKDFSSLTSMLNTGYSSFSKNTVCYKNRSNKNENG